MASTESSPNPWTNWWTGWTFQDPNLDLDMEPTLPTTSNISPRSVQKLSGLFDNELAGISDDHAGNNLDYSTDDLLKSNKFDIDEMEGDMSDFLSSFTGDDFLNSFVDLSNFATEDQGEVSPATTDLTVPSEIDFSTAEKVIPDSRGENGSFSEVMDVESLVMSPSQEKRRKRVRNVEMDSLATGLDHDYVSKKKCRVSSPVIVDPFDDDDDDKSLIKAPDKVAQVQKYRIRREKNNVASKRSREIRKVKFVEMEVEADRLEIENERMRAKIIELEKMAKEMKASLIGKLAGKQ